MAEHNANKIREYFFELFDATIAPILILYGSEIC